MMETGYIAWIPCPLWQLILALESPPTKGDGMDCRVWVAGEWIIRCGSIIFKEMSLYETHEGSAEKAIDMDALYKDVSPWGLDRWKFWIGRFSEIGAKDEALGLSDDTRTCAIECSERMQRIIDKAFH
jgi:hypothetical protein